MLINICIGFVNSNICRILAAQWKCANPAKHLTEICSLYTSPWLISIGSRNGLAPIRHQAISCSNDDKNICCLESTLDVYEFNKQHFLDMDENSFVHFIERFPHRNLSATILIACATSYQNWSREMSIPLDCFVVEEYFLINCDNLTTIAIVGRSRICLVRYKPGTEATSNLSCTFVWIDKMVFSCDADVSTYSYNIDWVLTVYHGLSTL